MSNQTGIPVSGGPALSGQNSDTWRARSLVFSRLRRRISNAFVAIIYRLYSRQLMADVLSRPMPKHVAMIIDGNRRFAIRSRLPHVTEGHKLGAEKVSEVVNWCDDLGIPVVTSMPLNV